MNVRLWGATLRAMGLGLLVVWALLMAPLAGHAQGFAGLGSTAEGFALPQRGQALRFPRDHGAHPDHRIEWWYLTANLRDASGTAYGVQWTLFRSAFAPEERAGWDSPQVWFAHAALTEADRHFVAERIARGGIGQAGVTATPFDAWIDDWRMWGDTLQAVQLRASGAGFAYDLALTARGPLVLHGDAGYSVKSEAGQASYYYSQPFYDITGTLTLPEGPVEVTGQGWLDREWSSQPLAADQAGWDWFSLAFDSGDKLMGFRLRDASGGQFTSGTWIAADGTATPLPPGAFRATPLDVAEVAGRRVPVRWRVELAAQGLDVTVSALNPQAWMDTSVAYWEGPVTVSGSHGGQGYLEMTGYAPKAP